MDNGIGESSCRSLYMFKKFFGHEPLKQVFLRWYGARYLNRGERREQEFRNLRRTQVSSGRTYGMFLTSMLDVLFLRRAKKSTPPSNCRTWLLSTDIEGDLYSRREMFAPLGNTDMSTTINRVFKQRVDLQRLCRRKIIIIISYSNNAVDGDEGKTISRISYVTSSLNNQGLL